jgi:hypothetical protein
MPVDGITADWNADRQACLRAITARQACLKIVLRTKDDPWLLDDFIQHHIGIVGPKNIIIFDNLSTDPKVADIYDKQADNIVLISYRHNIHSMVSNQNEPELYRALSASSEFFILLDTDEFLVWLTGDMCINDSTVLTRCAAACNRDFLAGIWLRNVPGISHKYFIGQDHSRVFEGLKWGKPLIAAASSFSGVILHNCQAAQRGLHWSDSNSLYVLHCNQLYPKQRIRTNINKLRTAGIITDNDSIWTFPSIRDLLPESVNRTYLTEIIELSRFGDYFPSSLSEPNHSYLNINADGHLSFAGEQERRVFETFVTNGALLHREVFNDWLLTQPEI